MLICVARFMLAANSDSWNDENGVALPLTAEWRYVHNSVKRADRECPRHCKVFVTPLLVDTVQRYGDGKPESCMPAAAR